ncbi:phosphatidylserine decarboxylase precursor-related protein [Candidatus Methanoperedens nitroreducens]|uniref:Putative archaetidylserine decarboxylase proenzyme n=1 Tax=Candidatus Methanoperedens nitratireducens TaxID=1392998 RepID=A0A062V2P7_9EURY|nr:phosphatidylserine decarboxylase [Candidatus Methanoperedens nitroreducens]KCZ73361.1 phosphatidylserine decarboxylase precursor-related protein [Candidatus Methanoperedens nitroreducens]MDJ1422690.1 phosphatidylserine decarboxylase [Candidatus Methanoperedens sp.]
MLAKGSFSWIGGMLLLTAVMWYISVNLSGPISIMFRGLLIIGFVLTLFFLVFFRDPERTPSGDEDDMVSPADGRVISVTNRKLCIFMNIHDVHVNRAPLAGTVTQIDYKPGGYIPAFNKDSHVNERNHVVINTYYGDLELTQIAGILTRRIVSYISEGYHIKRGERIGMIRFGSRVDVVIPEAYEFVVGLNDRVRAGETVIAVRKEKIRR